MSLAPRLDVRATVLPATGLLLASFKVTLRVEVVTPSLATVAGEAVSVEVVASATLAAGGSNRSEALNAPAAKVNERTRSTTVPCGIYQPPLISLPTPMVVSAAVGESRLPVRLASSAPSR